MTYSKSFRTNVSDLVRKNILKTTITFFSLNAKIKNGLNQRKARLNLNPEIFDLQTLRFSL